MLSKEKCHDLGKKEISTPENFDHNIQSCILKRDGIQTYKMANEILNSMLQKSDSDAADRDTSGSKKVLMRKGSNAIAKVKNNPDLHSLQNSNRLPSTTHTVTSGGMLNINDVSVYYC